MFGEVKNNSADSMNYVKVVYTFYDVVGHGLYTNVVVLRPAVKSSFEMILNDAQQSHQVSNYKLSVSDDKTQPC
ncbi:MAG TPA: FxLYD domain-containing protein [Nitrososphaeraceae archaeon]